MESTADILIVGAGASGAAAAWSLGQAGNLQVVCLEQGEHLQPDFYPSHEAGWELRRHSDFHIHPSVRARPSDYPVDDSGSPISVANFNAVGGSTILYSGHFPRMHPSDFCVRRLDGVGADWPLSYEDLEPYFAMNDRMMGTAGLVGDTAYPDHGTLQPPVPLGPMGRTVAQGFNRLGWHWWPSYSAINTRRHGNRGRCINLGPCNTGCSQGAKASVDVTYWPAAQRSGVRLVTQARVHQITVDSQGRASGALYLDASGAEHRIHARIVVLAASGLGTPRILLLSRSSAFPDGLANESGLVGRNLMLHPLGFVEGVFPHDLRSSIGPHGCCLMSQQFYETDPGRDFVRGYTMQVLRGAAPVETAVNGFFTRQVVIGPGHHASFRRSFNHTAGIAIIAEDLPEVQNRVELDPHRADSAGLPGLKVHYRLSENTQRMLRHGLKMARSVIEAAGGGVSVSHAPVRHAGWHLMGTTRMGSDRRDSVVNPHGQAHDVPNLFIVDSSVFPTGGAVNPVATAQALTLYLCDHIKKHLSRIA
jgi:choline dehydrogenase-like flavoprotein